MSCVTASLKLFRGTLTVLSLPDAPRMRSVLLCGSSHTSSGTFINAALLLAEGPEEKENTVQVNNVS